MIYTHPRCLEAGRVACLLCYAFRNTLLFLLDGKFGDDRESRVKVGRDVLNVLIEYG
jgi:hypothetical protein